MNAKLTEQVIRCATGAFLITMGFLLLVVVALVVVAR